ncbi:Abi family protein [Alloscardovia omnicolens]|uniref:Abi family protein n=1 Tax=Alloscardovia omnicolens TaxID=419015 RepID=UPI003A6FB5E5
MKSAKTIDEMIELFKKRKLTITDEESFRSFLYNNNYYRLSGYFRAFQISPAQGDNRFISGTTDEDFIVPYILDTKLRELILKGISVLEISIRSHFAYEISQDGHAYDYISLSAYTCPSSAKNQSSRETLIRKIEKWIQSSSEVCIKHYRKAQQDIPIWAAVETLPFDTVSKMLSYHVDTSALRKVYESLGLPKNLKVGSNTVHAMVYLRNLCAHHSRLWKRETVISAPRILQIERKFTDIAFEQKSIAASLIPLMHMVDNINENTQYSEEILQFLHENDQYMHGITTPVHWK